MTSERTRSIDKLCEVVDVRETREYEAGHIPGAVNVSIGAFRDPTGEVEVKLPTADDFAALLGNAGVSTDDRVVASDDNSGVSRRAFSLPPTCRATRSTVCTSWTAM